MKFECAHDALVDVNALVPNPKNPNSHPARQIELLAKIISYQGQRSPIVVSNRSGFITKGHGRLDAIKKLGWVQAAVDYQDYESEAQEYADMVADNKIAELAEHDDNAMIDGIKDLGITDFELLGLDGFSLPEVIEPQCDEDEVPEVVDTRCKLGDVWTLGRHRLMCGDSTRIDQVTQLMSGALADLLLTDPPYGVSYKSNGAEDKHRKIENDSRPLDEMKIFWTDCAASAFAACSDKAAYYWFACQGGDQMMMMMMSLGDGGWQVKHELMWLKDRLVLGRCDYHYKHEPILYGWKRGGTHEWYGDRKQTSVLECAKPTSSDLHPTMKPIELLEPLINNSTKTGQNILDLFGGSGSTLIAAEKTNRNAFLMEIDPHYCDVILARWEKYTGKTAELTNGPT